MAYKQQTVIDGSYMVLPIRPTARKKTVSIVGKERLLYDFKAHIDFLHPKFYMYLPVGRFLGEEVTLSSEPEIDLAFTFTDRIPKPTAAMAPERPQIHFSAPYGWLNDPNGLVYHDGLYHLYYQHNPIGVCWDNMLWGHAVSRDLIDWKDLGCAAFPDEKGICFSGCGFYDKDNRSGLGAVRNPPLLFHYTAAGNCSGLSKGEPFTQCLLYSLDGGMTLQKYEKNPILPHIVAENRDPKIVWCEELSCYVMALYLDGAEFALFTSGDLLHWEELQRITLAGDGECPAFLRLAIEGSGEHRWVLMGACNRYLVGSFRDGVFVSEQEPLSYHYNASPGVRTAYAAQSFDNMGERQVRTMWQELPTPYSCFCGQMTLPQEMALRRVGDCLRLVAWPIHELTAYYEETVSDTFDLNEKPYVRNLVPAAYDLSLSLSEGEGELSVSLFGCCFHVSLTKNRLCFGKEEIPLRLTEDAVSLRILSDTCGLEIYADGGLIYTTTYGLADYGCNSLTLTASGGCVKGALTLHRLKSIDPSDSRQYHKA